MANENKDALKDLYFKVQNVIKYAKIDKYVEDQKKIKEEGLSFWGGITGKNRNLQNKIDSSLATAQYASQQTLQKLAEQNLMSFELITKTSHTSNGNCSLKIQQYRQSDNKLSPCSRSG